MKNHKIFFTNKAAPTHIDPDGNIVLDLTFNCNDNLWHQLPIVKKRSPQRTFMDVFLVINCQTKKIVDSLMFSPHIKRRQKRYSFDPS